MKKKIRVGMIGYGFMGKAHTNAFRQAAKFFPDLPYEPELKIFCARNEDRANQFASNWGYEKVVTDWKEVVESDEIDLIDINNTTPLQALEILIRLKKRNDF